MFRCVSGLVGAAISVSCTWHVGHQDKARGAAAARRSMVRWATRPDVGKISGAELQHTATGGRAAHHAVTDAHRVHDVERKQHDMRRLHDVAAGVENHLGRWASSSSVRNRASVSGGSCRRDSTRTPLVMAPKRVNPVCRRAAWVRCAEVGDTSEGQHQARVHAVLAGLDAMAAAGADLGPALASAWAPPRRTVRIPAVRDCGSDVSRPAGARHRADFRAGPAGGAAVEDILCLQIKGVVERAGRPWGTVLCD